MTMTNARDQDPPDKNPPGKWTGKATGSEDAKEQKRYMQGYLRVIFGIYGKWNFSKTQQKLANQAFSIRMSPSDFALLIRRKDPRYVGSRDYKDRISKANAIYQQFRGYGATTPHEFAHAYATSDLSPQRLVEKIQATKWFRQRYPNWKQAVNSTTITNSGAGAQAYISMRNMLNNAFRANAGQAADPLLHKMMFSAGMSEADVANNLAMVFGGREALQWATGSTLDNDDILRAALTKRFGQAGLSKIANAKNIVGTFQNSKAVPFQTGIDEQSGNIVMPRI